MKISKHALWIFIIFYAQQLPGVASWGIDMPLLFVVLMGVRTTVPKAAGWGFLVGFLQDLLSGGWIGPNTIAKTLTGVFSSLAKRHIYHERVLTQTFLVFAASVFHQICIWLLLKWDGTSPLAVDAFTVCLRSVCWTTLVGVVVCFFVVRFRKRRFDPATA